MIKELLPLACCRGISVRKHVMRRVYATSTYQIVQRLLHKPLVLGVQRRSSLRDIDRELVNLPLSICCNAHLIQYENRRSLEDRSCERHTLLLPSGQPYTTFSNHSLVTCNVIVTCRWSAKRYDILQEKTFSTYHPGTH
jgi:hypothetical protein